MIRSREGKPCICPWVVVVMWGGLEPFQDFLFTITNQARFGVDENTVSFSLTDGSGMESGSTPTSSQPTSGNGVVSQPKKIRGIGFGDIFREGSVTLKPRLPSPEEKEEKKEKVSVTNSANKLKLLFLSICWSCITCAVFGTEKTDVSPYGSSFHSHRGLQLNWFGKWN